MSDAMAELVHALDDVLDIEAGLADALLPDTHRSVVTALSDVLDVKAGLERIQPAVPATALATFAGQLAQAAPGERLAARIWLPHKALSEIRTTAASSRWLDFGEDLDNAYAASLRGAYEEWSAAIDLAIIKAGRCARSLIHIAKTALSPQPMIGVILADLRALAEGPPNNTFPSATRDLLEAFQRVRKHQARMRTQVVVDALRAVADLPAAREFATALRHDALAQASDEDIIVAVELLEAATTDFAAVDLSETDLRGIPLNGLRWSTTTRWPSQWADQIRDNSIELRKGLYEIRSGTTFQDSVAFVQ